MYIYERTEKQTEHIRPVLVEMFLVGGIINFPEVE